MRFGQRLWICPSCVDPIDEADAVNLILDPGLAFGTGTHPSTALCLNWLAEHIKPGQRLVDFGCGSGILALAAIKLGAEFVYAIDHDPQALIATADNAARNNITDHHYVACHAENLTDVKADYLVANIVAKPLMELAPLFAKWLAPTATIVLAGILLEQVAEVIAHYATVGLHLTLQQQQEEWALLQGQGDN